jgi:G6PDH family F420-dependent oxidoreductase
MTQIGYTLMGEQCGPRQLVADAAHAEMAGFDFAVASDHFFPWLVEQGHAPYAWSVLGAVAQATNAMELMSFVTCPIRRYHPAVVAQKAATMALLSEGRFTLGLGAGENLNEHIVGDWPHVAARHGMFTEALEIIRRLLRGEDLSFAGRYFTVPEARLWDVPDDGVPMGVAVSGPASCQIAAALGDAMIAVVPDHGLVDAYTAIAGRNHHRYGQVAVCWGPDEEECRRIAHEQFRWFGLGWPVNAELPGPTSFASASHFVTPAQVAETIPCGPDPKRHLDAVRGFIDAGFTHVALVQIGADSQTGFIDFAAQELLPVLASHS